MVSTKTLLLKHFYRHQGSISDSVDDAGSTLNFRFDVLLLLEVWLRLSFGTSFEGFEGVDTELPYWHPILEERKRPPPRRQDSASGLY